MRKILLYGALSLAALIPIALIGIAGWLLGTPEGARLVLDAAAKQADARLEIRRLEGTLRSGLRLKGVTVRKSGVTIRANQLGFDWQPLMLLTGNLAVERLDAKGVDILDERPVSTTPVDLGWPVISGPAAHLNGWITSLAVKDLFYRRAPGNPLAVSRLSARLDWRGGRAAITGLDISSPGGRITGATGISFREPVLNLFATVVPARPQAGFSRLLLLCELTPGRGKEHAAGTLRATAITISNRRFDLSTLFTLSRDAVAVKETTLTEKKRKGRISGQGGISFADRRPAINARLKAEGLDLSPELPTLPPLSGEIALSGHVDDYRGTYHLSAPDKGWRSVAASGSVTGNREGAALAIDRGTWLGGSLGGSLRATWNRGFILSGELRGRGMDPARITPDWKGIVNLDLSGELRSVEPAPLSARVEGRLLSSRLRGRALTGELAARLSGDAFILDRLFLLGKGFDIRASGDLHSRIGFAVRADDLGGLVPGSSGTLRADGELLRRGGRFGGSVSGRAGGVKAASLRAGSASFSLSVGEAADRPVRLRLDTKGLEYAGLRTSAATLGADGTLGRHAIDLNIRSNGAELRAALNGGYGNSTWTGQINLLSGRDGVGPWNLEKPASLKVSGGGATLSPLVLAGSPGERIEAGGEMSFSPAYGHLNARWQKFNLARVARWTREGGITGSSSGTLSFSLPRKGQTEIDVNAGFTGSVAAGEYRLEVRSGTLRVETAGQEIRARAALDTVRDGRLTAAFSAQTPADFTLPDRGTFEAALEGGDFRAIRPWLPAGISLDGGLNIRASGEWLPTRAFLLRGSADIGKGSLAHHRKGGDLRADFRSASISLDWQGDTLGGSGAVDLAGTGHVKADFRLPVAARFPVSVNRNGAVSLSLQGKARESGLLTSLFPGMIQESKGELDLRARAAGTWEKPDLSGRFQLAGAGAYLPRAGVTLSEVRASARLEGDSLLVDSFTARSGQGTLQGSAALRLRDWRPEEYRGSLRGENFRLIYLPELQVTGSPRLDFSGTRDRLSVRGEILIPDLLVTGSKTPGPVRPSADVVIIDAPSGKTAPFPLTLDAQVRVAFGDRVFVKAEGIDARLAGAVDLTMKNPDDIRGKGEVRVVKGSYKAYGVNLEITKGRLVYLGGPVERPSLDILALRTIGEVKAGIILGGTLQSPVIRLYSEPGMSDSDIMAYIVLGHPLSGDRSQAGTVMEAAGLLLSAGQSAVLREQIAGRLGIDTLGMETHKGDATKSLLTVGKYLTPKLFISYGRSLFSPTSYVKARYTFSERWEVETWTGTESGVDLFYKINFE